MTTLNVNQPNSFSVDSVAHGEPKQSLSLKVYGELNPNEKTRIDLMHSGSVGEFDNAQCVYIDNYENDGSIILVCEETGQRIVCKRGKQGYYPILASKRGKFSATTTGSTPITINMLFLNFVVSMGEW